jgi:hypothetical protein
MSRKSVLCFGLGLISGFLLNHVLVNESYLRKTIFSITWTTYQPASLTKVMNDTYGEGVDVTGIANTLHGHEKNDTLHQDLQYLPPHPSTSGERHGFCSYLPRNLSASILWRQERNRIVEVMRTNIAGTRPDQKVDDPSYPKWLESLFTLLHPRFLRLGYKLPPLTSNLREVLHIIDQAMQKKNYWRPLNVVIVGGSVTQGRNSCVDPFGRIPMEAPLKLSCNWPYQLQKICDEYFGVGVIRILNLAVKSTTTPLSTTIIKYKLYPKEIYRNLVHGIPDVIINAYSTNDAVPSSSDNNQAYDTEFQREKRESAQDFIRSVRGLSKCTNLPLVIYVNDYLGNLQHFILGENTNGLYAQEISEWYGVMFISYAAVVRRLTYANQNEHILSPPWSYVNGTKQEVHLSLTGHIAITWVIAYSMLSMVLDFCDDNYDDHALSHLFPEQFSQKIFDMVERITPPPLNVHTQLRTVSEDWSRAWETVVNKTTSIDNVTNIADLQCTSNNSIDTVELEPCSIAFLAGPVGTIRNVRQLQRFLRHRTRTRGGWKAEESVLSGEGWTSKLGLVAFEPNATVTFLHASSPSETQALKIFYLKSYGEIWEGSKAIVRFRGFHMGQVLIDKSFTLWGYHNSNTSVSFEYALDLKEHEILPVNSRIEVEIRLAGGKQFKVTGLVVCNRP